MKRLESKMGEIVGLADIILFPSSYVRLVSRMIQDGKKEISRPRETLMYSIAGLAETARMAIYLC